MGGLCLGGGWEVDLNRRKYMYTYSWCTALCSRNYHNIVKWFFPIKETSTTYSDEKSFEEACVLNCFSRVQLFVTLWTATHQALLSMGFSRQEPWSGLPYPPPGDLPHPGVEPVSLISPTLAGRFFTALAIWKAPVWGDHKGIIPPFCFVLQLWTGFEIFIETQNARWPWDSGEAGFPHVCGGFSSNSSWDSLFEGFFLLFPLPLIWLMSSKAFSSLDLKSWCSDWGSLASTVCLLEMQNFSPIRERLKLISEF